MADEVYGANSMVTYEGKKIQIQSELKEHTVVTVVIMDGQVKKRYEKDVTDELQHPDCVKKVQKIINDQHKEVELRIRAAKATKEKEVSANPQPSAPTPAQKPAPQPEEEPKKRTLLDTLLRRKKDKDK